MSSSGTEILLVKPHGSLMAMFKEEKNHRGKSGNKGCYFLYHKINWSMQIFLSTDACRLDL